MHVKYRPDALGGALGLEHAQVVLHEERDVVEALQADVAEEVREPVAPRLVLGVGDRLARRRHDEQRLVGMLLRVLAWIHRFPLIRWRHRAPPVVVSPGTASTHRQA